MPSQSIQDQIGVARTTASLDALIAQAQRLKQTLQDPELVQIVEALPSAGRANAVRALSGTSQSVWRARETLDSIAGTIQSHTGVKAGYADLVDEHG